MAKLEVVLTSDGEGYYLADEKGETEESVSWGEVLEFNGTRYVADVDDTGEIISLAKLIDMPASAFETASEDEDEESDDNDEDDAEGETEDEEETDDVIIK